MKLRVDTIGGLRLLLTMLKEDRVTVDDVMELVQFKPDTVCAMAISTATGHPIPPPPPPLPDDVPFRKR